MFKYLKAFQCDNGHEFKNEVTKLLEKQNVDIRIARTKYKHTQKAFVEAFKKELDWSVQEAGNCVLYYLQDWHDRAFVREELMYISEDTQIPPDWVSEWK